MGCGQARENPGDKRCTELISAGYDMWKDPLAGCSEPVDRARATGWETPAYPRG